MRDDFNQKTKDTLARRVAYRCSNPNCRKPTSGPREDSQKAVNIGVAAHITAAEKGGPRYNQSISSEERKSIDNGIWLCQNCAKLIDNDDSRYTVDLLQEWKKTSEHAARLDIEHLSPDHSSGQDDIELIKFYRQCLDRPAFQDPFALEGSIEDFDRAIEDTITALNTGCLRARDGAVLAQAKGKSFLSNGQWGKQMDTIVDLLRAIRSRFVLAVSAGDIHLGPERDDGKQFYAFHKRELGEWMDVMRADVLNIFSEICEEAGVSPLRFPRFGPRFWGRW